MAGATSAKGFASEKNIMIDSSRVGRLEQVEPRSVWAHEARDFTRWMLENADVLSSVLGMDLELSAAEHPVGGFSLDLIGRDSTTNDVVIVENQLEVTDHSHLGQVLTYAGGTNPVNIVWCAPRFREEHRAALDWLNDRTDEHTRFFGVEIAVVRIDASRPAPLFRLVAQPNDWTKQVRAETQATGQTPKPLAYETFWGLLLEQIRSKWPSWTAMRRPPRDSWIMLPFGTSGVQYSLVFATQGLRIELYFDSSSAEANFHEYKRFDALRSVIEAAFEGPLIFDEMDGKKACRIGVYGPSADVLRTEEHEMYVDWILETLPRFRHAMETARTAMA